MKATIWAALICLAVYNVGRVLTQAIEVGIGWLLERLTK